MGHLFGRQFCCGEMLAGKNYKKKFDLFLHF
jgi:hypothetical protein